MVFIIKYIGVALETLLMAVAILITPLMFLIALFGRIRYGQKMPNLLSDLLDTIRTLFGYCKEIVAA